MIEVRFSKTAAQHIIDAAINWRTHHPQKPELFNEELQRAIDLLERHPEIGPRARTKRYKEARVLVMRETSTSSSTDERRNGGSVFSRCTHRGRHQSARRPDGQRAPAGHPKDAFALSMPEVSTRATLEAPRRVDR